MKFSEAILKGCAMVPEQCTDALTTRDRQGRITGACVLGAAAVGSLGREASDIEIHAEVSRFLMAMEAATGVRYDRADWQNWMAHPELHLAQRNDAGETRESIALWLRGRGL